MKKTNPNGSKTIYVGGIYEVDKTSGGSVTRTVTYYPAGGAMRINITGGSNTLYYILKDHLGSASVVTDATGTVVGEQRYYPYGETRFTSGTIYTDKLFTGQRDVGLGIYHYGARFYSPKLGRFLSADTIIPSYSNSQHLNRYMYVLGNPLRYTDPTGHAEWEDPYLSSDGTCDPGDTSCNWVGNDDDDDGGGNNDDDDDDEVTIGPTPPPACASGGMYNCPPAITFPDTYTYHLLDNPIVDYVPIYDYSYYPPLKIGYRQKFYNHDGFHFSLKNFLLPSDPITWASTAQTAGDILVTAGKENLGELATYILPICPECTTLLTAVALVDSANSAITFDGHLVTSVVYFKPPPISVSPSGKPLIHLP